MKSTVSAPARKMGGASSERASAADPARNPPEPDGPPRPKPAPSPPEAPLTPCPSCTGRRLWLFDPSANTYDPICRWCDVAPEEAEVRPVPAEPEGEPEPAPEPQELPVIVADEDSDRAVYAAALGSAFCRDAHALERTARALLDQLETFIDAHDVSPHAWAALGDDYAESAYDALCDAHGFRWAVEMFVAGFLCSLPVRRDHAPLTNLHAKGGA